MLKDDFFTITAIQEEDNSIKAFLELNAKHKIFDGHFPGQPVVPGACMLQMLKEILEEIIGKKLQLTKAHDLKFLAMINPNEHKRSEMQITYNIEKDGMINVSAKLLTETIICFKFSGLFKF